MSGESEAANDKSEKAEQEAPESAEAARRAPEDKRKRKIVTGTAIGIGSAAIVAALLYANRNRKSAGDKREDKPRQEKPRPSKPRQDRRRED